MNWRPFLKALLATVMITGFPLSCDMHDCSDASVSYRIDGYSLRAGKFYQVASNDFEYSVFEESDSIHFSEFGLQLKADSLIEVGKKMWNSGGIMSTAMACSPAFTHINPIVKLSVRATDTLIFQRIVVLPGEDITSYLSEGDTPPWYLFYNFNKNYTINFSTIPSNNFKGKFLFEILARHERNEDKILGESQEVFIYF